MNKIPFLIFAIVFLNINLFAQINISGIVFYDNKPLENANVFLNNTTIGTTSDMNGEFTLKVKEGVHELIVSHVGFNTINYILYTEKYSEPILFFLVEEDYIFDEIVIGGKRKNDHWEYDYTVFKEEFIGTSEFSKQCKILNPKVLYFDYDAQKNILEATASEPLHIRNKALGYDIYFTLEEFIRDKNKTIYLGYTQLKNLEGGKYKKRKWRKNRLIAYKGSKMHFFKSIFKNTTREEGFIVHQFMRKKNEERPSEAEILKARNLVDLLKVDVDFGKQIVEPQTALDSAIVILNKVGLPKHIDYLYKSDVSVSDITTIKNDQVYFEFQDNLSIVFTKEKEEIGYILRDPFSKPRKALFQTSSIIPVDKSSIINESGILENPLSVIYEGYLAFEKYAHYLPLDYDPTEQE